MKTALREGGGNEVPQWTDLRAFFHVAYKEVTHVEPGRILRLRRESSGESAENEEIRIYRAEYWGEDSHTTLRGAAEGAVEYPAEY